MPSFAQATLLGHLGRDPETRRTPSGESVTSVSLATRRKRKNGETTTWWRATLWGQRGEALARYLRKGDPVLLSGEPFQREWTDSQGVTRISLELEVRDWSFAGSKAERQDAAPPTARLPATQERAAPFDDDIPFD